MRVSSVIFCCTNLPSVATSFAERLEGCCKLDLSPVNFLPVQKKPNHIGAYDLNLYATFITARYFVYGSRRSEGTMSIRYSKCDPQLVSGNLNALKAFLPYTGVCTSFKGDQGEHRSRRDMCLAYSVSRIAQA